MLVEEIGYNVLGPVDNAKDAEELIYSKRPEIILMDHEIKGDLMGIELGEKIKHLNIPILYITSFSDELHYQKAKQSNMIGFLVKPIEKISLRTTLELAIQNAYLKSKNDESQHSDSDNHFLSKECLFIKKNGAFHKLAMASIAYVTSNDNYSIITTADGGSFIARTPLAKMEKLLPINDFMRTHRQFIIRLDKIDVVDLFEGFVKIGEKTIPISRAKRKELSDMLKMLN
jgi:DNA-binding LytR/AlgR family response regulator